MRCRYYSFAVLNVRLKAFQPVGAGTFEAVEIQDSFARKHTGGGLFGFERSVELPSFVGGIEIMRGDEHLEAVRLRRLEDSLHVIDRVIFLKTFVNQRP